ncbi:MAG: hypothetical protein ABIH99_05760 [Candidatus Micrarchaeota archaeon]
MSITSQILQKPAFQLQFPKTPSRIPMREKYPLTNSIITAVRNPKQTLEKLRERDSNIPLRITLISAIVLALISQSSLFSYLASQNFKVYLNKRTLQITQSQAKAKFGPDASIFRMDVEPTPLLLFKELPKQTVNIIILDAEEHNAVYEMREVLHQSNLALTSNFMKLKEAESELKKQETICILKKEGLSTTPTTRTLTGFSSGVLSLSSIATAIPVFILTAGILILGLIMAFGAIILAFIGIQNAPGLAWKGIKLAGRALFGVSTNLDWDKASERKRKRHLSKLVKMLASIDKTECKNSKEALTDLGLAHPETVIPFLKAKHKKLGWKISITSSPERAMGWGIEEVFFNIAYRKAR